MLFFENEIKFCCAGSVAIGLDSTVAVANTVRLLLLLLVVEIYVLHKIFFLRMLFTVT